MTNIIYSSDIQINYKLHPWQSLVEIIEQFRSKERWQSHDTNLYYKWIVL